MKVKVGDEEIDLDNSNLIFDESNINEYLKNFAAIYGYFNAMWVKAQHLNQSANDELDEASGERFKYYKENEAGSDKLTEAKIACDPIIVQAKKKVLETKFATNNLYAYLRSLDKAHQGILNYCFNIRKEIDKICPQISKMEPKRFDAYETRNYEKKLDEIFNKEEPMMKDEGYGANQKLQN